MITRWFYFVCKLQCYINCYNFPYPVVVPLIWCLVNISKSPIEAIFLYAGLPQYNVIFLMVHILCWSAFVFCLNFYIWMQGVASLISLVWILPRSYTYIYFLQVIHIHAHQRTQMSESLQIAEKEGCCPFEDASSAYRNHYYFVTWDK